MATVLRIGFVMLCACGRIDFARSPDASFDAPDARPPPELCGDTSGVKAGAIWPLEHGCPTNSGRSAFVGPASSSIMLGPIGTNNGRRGAAIGTNHEFVIVDADAANSRVLGFRRDGTATWASGIDPMGIGNTYVAIDDQNVGYVGTNYGKVFGYDFTTGAKALDLQFGGAYGGVMTGPPGTIYFGSNVGLGFYAIDTVMRQQRWHFDVPNMGDANTTPAYANGFIYFVDPRNSRLFALDPITGAVHFDKPIANGARGSVVVAMGFAFVATSSSIEALDALTGEPRWSRPVGEPVVQPALLANGDLVSSTLDGDMFILAPETGTPQQATVALGTNVRNRPLVDAANNIYFETDAGIRSYDATGTLRWESTIVGPFVLGDGYILAMPPSQTLAVIGP